MPRTCRPAVWLLTAAVLFAASPTGFAWLDPASPDVTTVLDSQDNQFAYGTGPLTTGWNTNYGTAKTSLLHGWFDQTGLKFDLSSYKGRIVEQAEIHLAKASTDTNFSLVAATINTDWSESAACWRYRTVATATDWTFPYSDFSTTFGSYGSLACYAYLSDGTVGTYTSGSQAWVRARLDPAVVQALILDQYGLVVTDARVCYNNNYNCAIYTKEQGSSVQPRLYIKFSTATDTTPPDPVASLAAAAGAENGAAVLRFLAPSDPEAPKAFGYTVRYSLGTDFAGATDVARWRIPRPAAPGTAQRVLIENLAPGATYTFFVQAYDAAGNGGTVQSVSLTMPAAWTTPVIPDGGLATPDAAGKSVRAVGSILRYWAGSETVKINPVTGNRMEDGYTGTGSDNYKKANVVWDAGTNTISLSGSRNEVLGAQLFVERTGSSLTNVSVSVSDLANLHGPTIPANPYVELFQLHYVTSSSRYYPDPAIPLSSPFAATFSIPDASRNPSGKNQSVWMDLYVPKDQPTGDYTGTVTINAAQLSSPVTINLKVHVGRAVIPDYPTFLVDLNGYGNPWNWGGSYNVDMVCLRYFQVAHKHRAVCNTLPYGQAGSVQADRAPTLTGAGASRHAADWTAHDSRYGRFFDGSAFTPATAGSPYYGPGQNTPITHLYTPFFESWPISDIDATYGFDAAGLGGAYWNSLMDQFTTASYKQFFTTMPDIYPAFTDGYKQGVRNVMADWFSHAHAKGWTRTNFQIYLNNKYYYKDYGDCTALWILEECEAADDFRAVGFFHQLYREGQAQSGVTDVPWHYRIDISTRWAQHWGQLDNRINFMDVNSSTANWDWPQIKYRNYHLDEDKQEQWMWYGLATSITSNGIGHAQVLLQKWCQNFTAGLQYWDNYQTSWSSAQDLCTVYPGSSVPGQATAFEGPVFSIRIKATRQVEQVIELLNLIAGQPGWSREKIRAALSAKYGNGTWDYSFGGLTEIKLYQLRADLMALLDSLTAKTGDFNGDGQVDVVDLLYLVDSFGTVLGDAMYDPYCDTNHDGSVDVADLLDLVYNFGT
jgi:hypothetical protein